MPWTARFIADDGIIEMTYEGILTEAELHASVHAAVEYGTREDTLNVLADCTRIIAEGSLFDVVELVNFYDQNKVTRRMREAVIVDAGSPTEMYMRFYETVACNRGYTVRTFTSAEDARNWLRGEA
ncbi:MAG: STAS/SEC14 domain-containing protein [Ignavibacteriae bacterium]|nr:STAS/SEC14 domain-containing protein [Ignavibacteriota bacterium]